MIWEKTPETLANVEIVSILRTNVRNKKSNRKVMKIMSAVVSYQLTNPRKLFRGLAIVALAASFSIASISGSFAGTSEPGALEFVTVQSGDSLWSLADQHAQGQDPRDWIAEVVILNALQSAELTPGQQIALP
ncbi:MAG: hypothetical protein RL068_705 [Actinomycetota bacterium]